MTQNQERFLNHILSTNKPYSAKQLLTQIRVTNNIALPSNKSLSYQETLDTLKEIVDSFWDLDVAHFLEKLNQLEQKPFPHIQRRAQELRVLMQYRDFMVQQPTNERPDRAFLHDYAEIVLEHPARAKDAMDRFTRKLDSFWSLHRMKVNIEELKKNYNDLFQLRDVWFEHLLKSKAKEWRKVYHYGYCTRRLLLICLFVIYFYVSKSIGA